MYIEMDNVIRKKEKRKKKKPLTHNADINKDSSIKSEIV